MLRSWAPFFIFWPPIYFPRHSLPTNPLSVTCYQVTWSQGVPRILLDCHVTLQSPLAISRLVIRPIGTLSFFSYCSLFLAMTHLLRILFLALLSMTHLLRILSLALTSLESHHSIVLPIRSRDLSLVYKSDHISRVGP